jgi:hypothetical protein
MEDNMTDTNQSRPAFRLYSVTGEGEAARWTDIGAAWPTRDGKGFNLSLTALPINGRIVMRGVDAKAKAS